MCLPPEITVILDVANEPRNAVFVGRLAQFTSSGLSFDYVVLDDDLRNHLDRMAEMKLKRESDPVTYSKTIQCRIVYDESLSSPLYSFVPTRRCLLKFSEPVAELSSLF